MNPKMSAFGQSIAKKVGAATSSPLTKKIVSRPAQVVGTLAEGGARSAALKGGYNYTPGRGFQTVGTPTRTAAQAATWGNTGSTGNTQYSGFGQLDLDRGFRGVHNVIGHDKMEADDEKDVAPSKRDDAPGKVSQEKLDAINKNLSEWGKPANSPFSTATQPQVVSPKQLGEINKNLSNWGK